MQILVSYARTDRPKVDALSQKLRQAGNIVWLVFWLSIAILVLYVVIITASTNSSTSGAAGLLSRSWL